MDQFLNLGFERLRVTQKQHEPAQAVACLKASLVRPCPRPVARWVPLYRPFSCAKSTAARPILAVCLV
jgi:hypothetical protein